MKYISFIGYGLLAISVIITGLLFITGDFTANSFPFLDLLVNWTIIILILAIAAAVILPLLNTVKNPKSMIKSLMGVGVVCVVLLICYLLADDAPVTTVSRTYEDKTGLLVSDASIYAMYITIAVSILAVVVGEVMNVFKK